MYIYTCSFCVWTCEQKQKKLVFHVGCCSKKKLKKKRESCKENKRCRGVAVRVDFVFRLWFAAD